MSKSFFYDGAIGKGPTMSSPHSVNNQGLMNGFKTSEGMQGMEVYF